MANYKNREVQVLFSISSDTVRVWSEEFSQYLSPLATPGIGKHRVFNDDDLRVLALISDLRSNDMSYEEIHVALKNGERGDLREVAGERALQVGAELQLSIVQEQVSQLQVELHDVRQRAQVLHDENIRLQTSEKHARERIEELTKELNVDRQKYQDEVKSIQREIGRLEAKLEMAQKQSD